MNNGLYKTLKELAPAVLISLIATSLGLLSLVQSQVPMIQDFGMMLAIGIAIAFLMAIFVLLPLLSVRSKLIPYRPSKATIQSSYQVSMTALAKTVYRLRYLVLILAISLSALGFYADTKNGVETDFEVFMPQDSKALEDIQTLRSLVGSTERLVLLVEADAITSYSTLEDMASITTTINQEFDDIILSTLSLTGLLDQLSGGTWTEETLESTLQMIPENQSKMFVSLETNQSVIILQLEELDDAAFSTLVTDIEQVLSTFDSSLEVSITGQSVVDQTMLEAMTGDRLNMTLLGIGLVFMALLLIYRNLRQALIAVLPILLIVGWSGGVMYLFGYDYTPLTSTLGALIIGIGTEFTILILMRYEHFIQSGLRRYDATIEAVATMGKPIIVSAITTMGGFSALILSDFQILSNFGIMTLVNLSLALLSSLVVLPALLGLFGGHKRPKQISS